MASPGKRKRKKMGPQVEVDAEVSPEAPKVTPPAPKPKKKKNSLFG